MTTPSIHLSLAGYYKLEAIRPDGTRRLLADWFPNIITNAGLNRIGTTFAFDRALVGTGSSVPSVSQTQLDSRIATTTTTAPGGFTSGSFTTGPIADHYGWTRWIYRFNTGVATGNLTEVGVGHSDTAVFSRALILDGNGNPTTVTVLADESLDVTYELRLYANVADVTGNITISGTTYAFVLRPSNYPTSFADPGYRAGGVLGFANPTGQAFGSGSLGAADTTPSGPFISGGSGEANGSYVANSFQRDLRYTWALNQGTTDFHNIAFIHGLGNHKVSFNPPLPKRNTNVLTLDLRVTWARRT